MFNRGIIFTGQLRKGALLLLGIYSIHIVSLLALMNLPGNNAGQPFKPLFTYSQQYPKSVPGKRPAHPAATYFSMLLKQAKSMQRSVLGLKHIALADLPSAQSVVTCPTYPLSFTCTNNVSGPASGPCYKYLLHRRILV